MRMLQKRLAEEMTVMVHSREEYNSSVEASDILFGKGTTESLQNMKEATFLSVFEGVPTFDINEDIISSGLSITDLCADHCKVFPSKGEMRRLVKGGGVSLNKEKITDTEMVINRSFLLNGKYLLVQKGKKNYFIIRLV